MKIQNRIAIVTGAAGGIGRATAKQLAKSGAEAVILSDIDQGGLEEVAWILAEFNCETVNIATDVTDYAQLEELYEQTHQRFGRVDIVFNNAGITSGPPGFPQTPVERVRQVIDLNLVSVLLSTQLAITRMQKQGGGVIINNSSLFAIEPFFYDAVYSASKAGVLNLTRCCEGLEASDNIRVRVICPGITNTPLLNRDSGDTPEQVQERLTSITLLEPIDVARGVVRLIEDDDYTELELILRN